MVGPLDLLIMHERLKESGWQRECLDYVGQLYVLYVLVSVCLCLPHFSGWCCSWKRGESLQYDPRKGELTVNS